MFDRFKHNGSTADDPHARSGSVATAENGEDATRVQPADRPSADTMRRVRARQREEYGGINWGAAFFGWLVAVGVAVLLTGLLAAAGAAIGLTESSSEAQSTPPETLSLAGAIALLAVLAIAYYCGGYVAGRMSRFDGARQGIGCVGRRAADHDRRRDPRRHRRVGVQRRRTRQPAAAADRRGDAHDRRRDRHRRDRARDAAVRGPGRRRRRPLPPQGRPRRFRGLSRLLSPGPG